MIKQALIKSSRFTALIVLCLVIAMLRPNFTNIANLTNILRQASILLVLSAGLTVTVITGGIDLSIAATLAFAACLGGLMLQSGISVWVVIPVILLCGVLIGCINGILISHVYLPAFIATYGVSWLAQGAANLVMRGEIFYGFPKAIRFLGIGNIMGVPVLILFAALVSVLLYFLLVHTTIGKSIFAVGANSQTAMLSGIKIDKTVILSYALSGFTAALAGVLYLGRLDAAEAAISSDMLLPALAAVVIGGTSLAGGEGGIGGTIIGALIMTVITNGMNLLGIATMWQSFAVGVVILVSVVIDKVSRSIEEGSLALFDFRKGGAADLKGTGNV